MHQLVVVYGKPRSPSLLTVAEGALFGHACVYEGIVFCALSALLEAASLVPAIWCSLRACVGLVLRRPLVVQNALGLHIAQGYETRINLVTRDLQQGSSVRCT